MTSTDTTLSPSAAVRAEIAAGAPTLADIARSTGLDRGLVELIVERLVLRGEVSAEPLQIGCPPQGCGGCALASRGDGYCGIGPAAGSRLPVALALRRPGSAPGAPLPSPTV